MTLQFTEDHQLLRQTARRFLADKCPMTVVRAFAESDARCHDELLAGMAEQGWLGMLIGEEYDGAGLDHRSLAIVLEETGRNLTPAPLLSTCLASSAIAAMGDESQKRQWLPRLADGSAVGAVAFTEPGGSWHPDAVSSTARADGDGYVLSGVKNHVLWAERADLLIVPAMLADQPASGSDDTSSVDRQAGELVVFAVPLNGADRVGVAAEVGVDPTRCMARVTLDGVRVGNSARLAAGTLDEWRALHARAWALLSAEMIGAAQTALLKTRDYANERTQFNRPIGAFQAVKHPLVNVMIALERARSLTAGALDALDNCQDNAPRATFEDAHTEAEKLSRMAKAAATQALNFATDRGVQLHGGFGFTWDCDMHWYFKRALWSAATLGDAKHHREHLADQLFAQS